MNFLEPSEYIAIRPNHVLFLAFFIAIIDAGIIRKGKFRRNNIEEQNIVPNSLEPGNSIPTMDPDDTEEQIETEITSEETDIDIQSTELSPRIVRCDLKRKQLGNFNQNDDNSIRAKNNSPLYTRDRIRRKERGPNDHVREVENTSANITKEELEAIRDISSLNDLFDQQEDDNDEEEEIPASTEASFHSIRKPMLEKHEISYHKRKMVQKESLETNGVTSIFDQEKSTPDETAEQNKNSLSSAGGRRSRRSTTQKTEESTKNIATGGMDNETWGIRAQNTADLGNALHSNKYDEEADGLIHELQLNDIATHPSETKRFRAAENIDNKVKPKSVINPNSFFGKPIIEYYPHNDNKGQNTLWNIRRLVNDESSYPKRFISEQANLPTTPIMRTDFDVTPGDYRIFSGTSATPGGSLGRNGVNWHGHSDISNFRTREPGPNDSKDEFKKPQFKKNITVPMNLLHISPNSWRNMYDMLHSLLGNLRNEPEYTVKWNIKKGSQDKVYIEAEKGNLERNVKPSDDTSNDGTGQMHQSPKTSVVKWFQSHPMTLVAIIASFVILIILLMVTMYCIGKRRKHEGIPLSRSHSGKKNVKKLNGTKKTKIKTEGDQSQRSHRKISERKDTFGAREKKRSTKRLPSKSAMIPQKKSSTSTYEAVKRHRSSQHFPKVKLLFPKSDDSLTEGSSETESLLKTTKQRKKSSIPKHTRTKPSNVQLESILEDASFTSEDGSYEGNYEHGDMKRRMLKTGCNEAVDNMLTGAKWERSYLRDGSSFVCYDKDPLRNGTPLDDQEFTSKPRTMKFVETSGSKIASSVSLRDHIGSSVGIAEKNVDYLKPVERNVLKHSNVCTPFDTLATE